MDPVFPCIAKILKLNWHEFHHLSKQWDGSEKSLAKVLKELNSSLKDIARLLIEAERIIKDCHKNKIHILWPGHKDYPQGFCGIHQPPLFLTYKGDRKLLHQSSISIVGSRSPQIWVENWLEQELKKVLLQTRVLTISGGARGIDQKVHQLSIRSSLSSLAILPSGLLNLYPQVLESYDRYIDIGTWGVMSEYFPHEPMRKHHFFARNRLIAACSPLLFVVQAHIRSGTMMTAHHAIDQGRTLCTLPSSPADTSMHGNLQLLFDGAQMVRWGDDLQSLIRDPL